MRLAGKILRTHGLKGNLLIQLDGIGLSSPERLKHIFLKQKSEYLPYRIHSLKNTYAERFHLELKGVDSKLLASKLLGLEIYVPEEFFETASFSPKDLIGYSLYNGHGLCLGELNDLIENGPLMWFEVSNSNASFLVPFHQDLILEIDLDNQILSLDLPEGLDNL